MHKTLLQHFQGESAPLPMPVGAHDLERCCHAELRTKVMLSKVEFNGIRSQIHLGRPPLGRCSPLRDSCEPLGRRANHPVIDRLGRPVLMRQVTVGWQVLQLTSLLMTLNVYRIQSKRRRPPSKHRKASIYVYCQDIRRLYWKLWWSYCRYTINEYVDTLKSHPGLQTRLRQLRQ